MNAAGADAEGFHVHAFIADAHAAEAENAARRVVIDERRPFLFGIVQLFFSETAVIEAVAESHVLQFAFAALVADRAIERMIGEQELEHVLARVMNLRRIGADDHAFGRDERAGRLQFGHFFDFDETHAARSLERKSLVVAERRDFHLHALGGIDHERAGGDGNFLLVDRERDLFLFGHEIGCFSIKPARANRARGDRRTCLSDDLRIRSSTF